MVTVAEIAARAFDAVAAKITDAIHPAALTRATRGFYNVATGSYDTTPADQTGRVVVDTAKPVEDVFPGYVVGPGEELILIEGMTSARENDTLTFAGRKRTIMKAQDIAAAGSLFYVIAR